LATWYRLSVASLKGHKFYSPVYLNNESGEKLASKIGDNKTEVGEWYAYSTFAERVLDDGVLLIRGKDYKINDKDVIGDALNCTVDFPTARSGHIVVLYSVGGYTIDGQKAYEWITVGSKSASVDSIGAAMISEAFDSVKNISVQWGSFDRQDVDYGKTVPYLLNKYGVGTDRDAYYHLDGSNRLALNEYWSSTIPIASSSIIGVG